MTAFKKVIAPVALGLFCCLVAGCGGNNVVPVSGTLTYKGKPVTNAYINFVPEKGRPSMGETDDQGNFVMTYDPQTKGVERGKHRVFVKRNEVADSSAKGALPGMPAPMSADMKTFFDKYSGENSKVTITVDKSVSDLKLDWD